MTDLVQLFREMWAFRKGFLAVGVVFTVVIFVVVILFFVRFWRLWHQAHRDMEERRRNFDQKWRERTHAGRRQ